MSQVSVTEEKHFKIKILGRMLEHLGVQMYKKRNTAIAELVANSWDAGATKVHIQIPTEDDYDREKSLITIEDNGSGMDEESIQEKYMIVGRNKRLDGDTEIKLENVDDGTPETRKVMGRKGIGKLAGFGIATEMTIQTWLNSTTTAFKMRLNDLKLPENESKDIEIKYDVVNGIPNDTKNQEPHGTRITLSNLKHKSPIDFDSLKESLSRRFSRTVRGQMEMYVNGDLIGEPNLTYKYQFPEDGSDYAEAELSDKNKILFEWRLADTTIQQPELRGFTIHVRGKTAQAPNFFFDVEGTAHGQHGTKVLVGTIEADFLDEGTDDESDYISTDRQELDWETDELKPLYDWGQKMVRAALTKNTELAADNFERNVLDIPGIRERIERLETNTQKQVKSILRILGKAEPDPEKTEALADALLKAYEYEHFHDSIKEIESIEEPEMLEKLLTYLHEWQVMESSAILEIIKGRLAIIDKFHQMVVNDAPETANRNLGDNMHDLIGGYPWLLNPEWQVLDEEKTISKQLQAWHHADIQDDETKLRYDFIALEGIKKLLVVEIKRVGHALELEDLQRLETYKTRLERAYDGEARMVIVYGGNENISASTIKSWKERDDILFLTWAEIYERAKNYYEHYRAVLEGDVSNHNFHRKKTEVTVTRGMLASGKMRRSQAQRAEGLGIHEAVYEVEEGDDAAEAVPNETTVAVEKAGHVESKDG